ncbi:inositol polyphosphate 1-phosphatase [Centruroides vittatus]|uniref:inositol polyphosphate 1-phosphatase n=1 Tax=Centruroides vittatus TaxID=120091 RepID=UPI00350EAD07
MAVDCSRLQPADTLLRDVINVSEKAAEIARSCRAERELFSLLIEEKKDDKKNRRFIRDFKTLADVLVQETIRYDLDRKYPDIGSHIYGEEENCFTNALGESISVVIDKFQESTVSKLTTILDGNVEAARLLASAVHCNVNVDIVTPFDETVNLPLDKIGIWIDPIDSTYEYIYGIYEDLNLSELVTSGLKCVCVLIGLYHLESGRPILGVINQPFHIWDSTLNRWSGRYFWGLSWNGINKSSLKHVDGKQTGRVVMSSSDDEELVRILKQKYEVVFVAGAGYKLLAVCLGLADFYVLSKHSTYRWDSCAPHSLLLSLGGGIVSYQKILATASGDLQDSLCDLQLSYHSVEEDSQGVDRWLNKTGMIAYRDSEALVELIEYIRCHK